MKEGIQQVIDRATVNDAAVLVLDKATFDNLMGSSYASALITELNRLDNLKNELGETKAYLRLVINLHTNANSAYHAIFDLIQNIP